VAGSLRSEERRRAVALVLLAAAGCGLAALATYLFFTNWQERYPTSVWGTSERVYVPCLAASCFALALCGPWLSWRLPRNPTGARLTALGACLSAWTIGTYWEHDLGQWMNSLLWATFRPLLFVAVLAWPTGRLPRVDERRVRLLVVAYVAIGVATIFYGQVVIDEFTPWGWDHWPIPAWGSPNVAAVLVPVIYLITVGVLGVAVLVALVRNLRRPGAASVQGGLVIAAGVVAVLPDLWLLATDYLASGLEWARSSITPIGLTRLAFDYGRFGAVGLLLVLAEASRRHALSRLDGRDLTIEIGDAAHARDVDVSDLLGDPTARLIWKRDAGWVDAAGRAVDPTMAGRTITEIADADADVYAAIEHDAGVIVSPIALEVAAARVRVPLVLGREAALATARLAELRALQRTLLDTQDAARRRVERDLHDGAQQRLVGLALAARLAARQTERQTGTADPDELAAELEATAAALASAPLAQHPAALDGGLAAALASLALTSPLPVELQIDGDVDGSTPAAVAAWFAVNDALANVLKHAHAEHARIALRVDGAVHIDIADDGIGGVVEPPPSLIARLVPLGGSVAVAASPEGGTAISLTAPLAEVAVVA
jgi:signal transduction histidine kinase